MALGKYVFLESTHPIGLTGGRMETRVTLKPGSKGTKKLVAQFGERLVCVRYRYDAPAQVRYKTVELVIDQAPWNPAVRGSREAGGPGRPPVLVGLRVLYHEEAVRKRVKTPADGGSRTRGCGSSLWGWRGVSASRTAR